MPVPIRVISIGEYQGGIHHIAAEREFKGELDGHLLISAGVISGDYLLEIHAEELKKKGDIIEGPLL